jgi:hypothetical protein
MTATTPPREDIERLLNAYCFTIDAGDIAAFSRLFARGYWGVVGDPAGFAHGSEAVAAVLENVILYDGKPLTRHLMTNVDIRIAPGADTATAESYITVMQAVPPDFPLQPIFVGRYCDRFQCDGGTWSFAAREIHAELLGDLSRHRADMA